MSKFTKELLNQVFTDKFVSLEDSKSTICIYVAKISYNEHSVWMGYHGFVPDGTGEVKLGRLEVIELPMSNNTINFPFKYIILDESLQETYKALYL